MKIEKLVIDGFGKLNNCTYTFSDGVNLIYGKNESGKSTICEFLLAMFYGLPNKGKASDDLAARIKYKSWNNDSFGGTVYFRDDNGKKLAIERSFKATKRGDKAILRDAVTWEELGDAEDIGQKYFGLTREAFLKTLYVKSFGADSIKSDDGEIMSRLSNLETSGDEDVSYSKIINNMEKEIFSLKTKTGRGGKITALEDRILNLNNELSMSEMTYTAIRNNEETLKNIEETIKKQEKEIITLEEQYVIALKHEKFLSHKKIEETKKVIENRLSAEEEKLKNLKSQLEKKDTTDIPQISAETISNARTLETKKLLAEEKADAAKREVSDKEIKLLDNTRLIPAFFGVVLILLGFFLKSNILFVAGTLVGVLGILLCVLINLKKRKENNIKEKAYQDAKSELDRIDEELSKIFAPFGVSVSDELSALFVATADKEKHFAQLKKQYEECEEEIKKLKESIPDETEIKDFPQEVVEYDGESAQSLFDKVNALKSESRDMLNRSNEISLRIAKETAEVRSGDEISAEIEKLTEEKQELLKRYSSLTRAYEWLNCAHNEIKNNFAPKLNKKASEMLGFLTGEKYEDMRSNDNFGINLKTESGGIVQAEFMSRGTYDLIYIALRFASMSVLTDGKIPPVILDDAFSQLDDERLKKSVELIKNSKEFSQVFLFTCHENYKEILKDSNVIELE